LATLTIPDLGNTQVSINWGNGFLLNAPALVTPNGNGGYDIVGNQTFNAAGTFPVMIDVTNSAGVQSVIHSTIRVNSPLAPVVTQIYQDLLHRAPDATGLDFWANQLFSGASRADVVGSLEGSPEYRTNTIQGVFNADLGRPADPSGLQFFLNYLQQGGTLAGVQASVLSSPEYLQRTDGSDTAFVIAVYGSVLGRHAEDAGLAYWTGLLSHSTSRESVVAAILSAPEALQTTIASLYEQVLSRPADASGLGFWAQFMASGHSTDAMLVALANSPEFLNLAGGSGSNTK
jgi:hypothetical protein